MKKKKKTMDALYRVYGSNGLDSYDEYCTESSGQRAADKVRSWHEKDESYVVIEVSKVVHNWR